MSPTSTTWGKEIAVETIRGIPFRMYTERPRHVAQLLSYAVRWESRPHVIQGDRTLTFGDLLNASAAKAATLSQSGIAHGARVFLFGWNSPEWIVNFWACQRLGAVPVLANAWWSEGELADALHRLQPAITLADKSGAAKMPAVWPCGPWELNACEPDSRHALSVAAANTALDTPPTNDAEDPALIIFTSGTGGRPKAVVHSHRSLLASVQMLLHVTRRLPHQIDDNAGDIALQTGPLFHIGGAGMILRSVVIGNTLVMPRGKFDPGETLALIEHHKITRWAAVPTMASRVIDHPDLPHRNLDSLTSLTLGGAPIHAELLQRIRVALPSVQARVPTGYGLTESGSQVTAASGADTAQRPGSCGRPLPCAELKILPRPGLPNVTEVNEATEGEVLVRTPTQMAGYYGTDESPIDNEGWLHTGDLGRIDENGHLWITGRSKDMIIRGGENIAPVAVERALMGIPGVVETVVFGIPHADLGEEVMAIVVINGDGEGELTAKHLQEQLRASVASFAVPSRWKLQKEPLLINNTGKVDKAALIAQVLAEQGKPAIKAGV